MHLNGDETVALGSAFRAANVSTSFKPRFVGMSDICPYSIGVELYRTEEYPMDETAEVSETPESDETPSEGLTYEEEKKKYDFLIKNHKNARSMELFTHNSHYKIQRKITLQAYENFLVHLYYSRPEELAESAVYVFYHSIYSIDYLLLLIILLVLLKEYKQWVRNELVNLMLL